MLKKVLIWVGIVSATITVLGAGFIFVLFMPGSTDKIVSVADKFKPDASWEKVADQVEPPRIVCLGDISCPSVHWSWKTQHSISSIELTALLKSAGWDSFKVTGDCVPNKGALSGMTVCEARGSVNGFNVLLSARGTLYEADDNIVSLFIDDIKR